MLSFQHKSNKKIRPIHARDMKMNEIRITHESGGGLKLLKTSVFLPQSIIDDLRWLVRIRGMNSYQSLLREFVSEAEISSKIGCGFSCMGIIRKKYFHAVGRLLHLDPRYGIDFVRIEDVSDSLRKHIEQEGIEL